MMEGAVEGWQRGRVAAVVLDVRTLHGKVSDANAGYQAAYKRGEQRQKASRTPLVGRQWSSLVVRQPARGEFRGESREKRRRTMMSERERLLAMEETEAT